MRRSPRPHQRFEPVARPGDLSFDSQRSWLAHHDRALHEWMGNAVIVVRPRLVEGVTISLAGIDESGVEALVGGRYAVLERIIVRPRDRRSDRYLYTGL